EGNRYFDASSGPITCNIGHANPKVLEAIKDQSEKVCFASHAFFENKPNRELAQNLVNLVSKKYDQAFFVSGGSEAIEASFKLARQYAIVRGQEKKHKIIARAPSYHGSTMGAFSASDDIEMEENFQSLTKISIKVPAPLSYRVPDNFDALSYTRFCLDELERTIIEEDPEDVLAFILEPVGGLSTGALVAPDFYYKNVREICDKYGILLIYDEVMSGAGRTGKFLAADHWEGSDPDLVILAKGLCAGYSPLGALLAPNKIVEPVVSSGGFLHGHTYASNPLSCAIANAVLNEVVENNLVENARVVGDYLKKGLENLASQLSIIGDVRGKGLLLAVEVVQDTKTKSIFKADQRAIYRISELGIKNGILLYTRKTSKGENGEWLMIAPPLISDKDHCDDLLSKLYETLKDFEKEQGIR
ncbi:aminotransferase class III-fold pyridoxal phosphate-dependent enzyme, partial [Paracoccaceae bacterium]|nr:aminotransferase class III-fold pyridoxal phosphate-dependent enzyme [Paracoccaceae bacterium]